MLFSVLPMFLLCGGLLAANFTTYDRYTGKVATRAQLKKYKAANLTSTCTIDIKDCDPNERERIDGSCNNLANPVKGTFLQPVKRLLPANYSSGSESRKAADGSALEHPRVIRTNLLCVGKSISTDFTQLFTSFPIWIFGDFSSIHDLVKTVSGLDCCSAQGRKNKECRPTLVMPEDPVHRFTGVNCLNMTKPILYSDLGCTDDRKPSPIQRSNPVMDMSATYNAYNNGDKAIRSFIGGQLTVDEDDQGITWPPNGNNGFCALNQPGETRCFGEYGTGLLQTMLLSTWQMRQHNNIASKLALVNPCWDDETLFQTARDINIAVTAQMYYYEFLPTSCGHENLVQKGVISNDNGFRDIYNKTLVPEVSLEYTYILRWFHTCQEAMGNMYSPDGTFLKQYPLVNTTFRPGFLDMMDSSGEKNIVLFTQQMFRQPSAKIGHHIHPELADNGVPYIQREYDIPSNDLHRGRYLGFAPYIDYVKMCTGHKISTFDDLKQHMDVEQIMKLKKVYKNVIDIELLAGVWLENPIKGGHIPNTAACIMMEFAKTVVESNRHWYERKDRPHAFTKQQLAEIRKASLAQMMCENADQVSQVQLKPLRVISADNPLTPCSDIPTLDYTAWTDPKSSCEYGEQEKTK